ncbi:MAG: pyridoxal phosphate-dependent aminotransferase [Chloroflexi bacterium]|nr:MAG: pyridoxal phosphate-dependent aminotransferase [Chloroflexota bacterium]TMG61171.1 MAG: pyridoxal phosphate-dependent aminotransferase [Chloroflexota bacterium]
MGTVIPSLAHGPAESLHSGIREIANEAIRRPGTIRLDVGQPDFPTPQHVKDAGKRAIDENKTFYTHTQGLLSLREKLVDKLARVNGIKTTPEAIACGPGGVGAIAAMFAAVLEQGDEVLLPDPGWPNYRMMLPWLGTRGIFYPCPPEYGFQPDLESLARLISPRTKILVVNSPNNPTGAVYPEATVAAMIDLAQSHNLWLLSDECYDQIVLDGSWTSPAKLAPDDDRIVTAFTFSKTYAMTGWRLGYIAGSVDLIDTATKVLESNSSCVSTITQVAAEAALTGPQDCVGEMVSAYRRRRDLVVDILKDAELLISEPTGAFYIMADVSLRGLPAREFSFALLREQGVSAAPGTAFGEVASEAVRISLASSEADLREGVGRLARFVHGST